MFFNHCNVDMIFANLCNSNWNIKGLHKQLLLFIILIFDEEGNPDIHWLHTLLKLHSTCRFYRGEEEVESLGSGKFKRTQQTRNVTELQQQTETKLWQQLMMCLGKRSELCGVCTSVISYGVVAWNHLQVPEVSSLNLFISQFQYIWVTGPRGS